MRDQSLQNFLDALERTARDRAPAGSPLARLAEAVFSAAAAPPPDKSAGWMPRAEAHGAVAGFVERHLAPTLDAVPETLQAVCGVAEAFRVLAPTLAWARRPAGPADGKGFREAHANATLIGADGLEARGDIRVGATLIGPGITYPEHSHPPEEFYLALSGGDFWNTGTGWWTPGTGGLVHNPPGIAHSMRAKDAPLLAIWCLDSRPPARP